MEAPRDMQGGSTASAATDSPFDRRPSPPATPHPMPLPATDPAGLLEDLAALGFAARPPPPLATAAAFEWVAEVLLWLCQR